MPTDMASSPQALNEWLVSSLASAQAGRDVPYTILSAQTGQVIGSTDDFGYKVTVVHDACTTRDLDFNGTKLEFVPMRKKL